MRAISIIRRARRVSGTAITSMAARAICACIKYRRLGRITRYGMNPSLAQPFNHFPVLLRYNKRQSLFQPALRQYAGRHGHSPRARRGS